MTGLPGLAGESIPKWKLEQLNLFDFGNTIQVSGVVYADKDIVYVCMMPDEEMGTRQVRVLDLDAEAWKKIVRQTDIVETEVLENAADGKLAKIIIRKSTRQIEQGVSWAVFRRDDFQCRYCGANSVPLTVDHLITWETGGPSIEENLVACCRKCNKSRGDMPYEEWLESSYYKRVSANLRADFIAENRLVATTLDSIPRRTHSRGR